jgi:tRNA A58 N-methylase Trm61
MTRAWLPQDGDCGDACERTAVCCLPLPGHQALRKSHGRRLEFAGGRVSQTAMNQPTAYIFDQNQCDRELTRLRRIESALDPQSHKLLTKTGVAAGWACLEIGAGGGSILQWLCERVGRDGRVVGLDNPSHR